MNEETTRQVEGLRAAAAALGGPTGDDWVRTVSTWPVYPPASSLDERLHVLITLPGAIARPQAGVLLVAAERIQALGHSLGLPVNNALEIAGAILGQDLGHNR